MSENNDDAKLPQPIPPTDPNELNMWLRLLFQVVRAQKEENGRMKDRIKELEDRQNG